MNNNEFEENIRRALHTNAIPNRTHLESTLSMMDSPVTEHDTMRYTSEVAILQNIINNIRQAAHSFRSKRIILVPSLILILIVSGFSLKAQMTNSSSSIERLAEESESIEEPGIDLDDQVILTSFDAPAINDLSINTNEINL